MPRDDAWMSRALEIARGSRRIAPPNPWVGSVIVTDDGVLVSDGATSAPGGFHAEIAALTKAGERARGATLYSTLEPCAHVGRTGACTQAIIRAGVARVVVAVEDPDPQVSGRGIAELRDAGVVVDVGPLASDVAEELVAYRWHRTSGRPYVVLKVAATLDGRTAMADGSSQWITSDASRADAHELRADSQAILVGAGTVRADNPRLTARARDGARDPLRVVLGAAPANARVRPCLERRGPLEPILTELASLGVLQLLVEGGSRTASAFVEAGLVNRVVWYVAPALAGDDGTLGALSQLGTGSMDVLRRGRILGVRQIGEDVRVDLEV